METRTEYKAVEQYTKFLLRLPVSLHRRIKKRAKDDRRTITQTMIMALEYFLEKSE